MNRKIFLPFFFMVAMTLASCASMDVNSDWDKLANFEALKTYAWVPGPQPKTGNTRIDSALLDSRIRAAVDNALVAKGYQKDTSGAPTFWVSYQASVEEKLSVMAVDMPYHSPSGAFVGSGVRGTSNWSLHGGAQTMTTQYEEGTLLIDVADPKTQNLMWRGTATDVIDPNASPDKREAKINDAVQQILSQFPPIRTLGD